MNETIAKEIITIGFYKGNMMLVFGEGEKYPFQFGAGKAQRLLNAIDAVGVEDFVAFLRHVAQSRTLPGGSE